MCESTVRRRRRWWSRSAAMWPAPMCVHPVLCSRSSCTCAHLSSASQSISTPLSRSRAQSDRSTLSTAPSLERSRRIVRSIRRSSCRSRASASFAEPSRTHCSAACSAVCSWMICGFGTSDVESSCATSCPATGGKEMDMVPVPVLSSRLVCEECLAETLKTSSARSRDAFWTVFGQQGAVGN